MTRRSRLRGEHWERVAAEYLLDRGTEILIRGYRCRLGELDLIVRDGGTLAIVEVRFRARSRFGSALESVGWHKQRRILAATRHLLMMRPRLAAMPVRFDVVAIDADASGTRIAWHRDAFRGA